MNQRIAILFFHLFLPLLLAAQTVVVAKLDGNINPVAAQFIHRAIATAVSQKAECLIIQLNTPGGLLKSTRVIVSDIFDAPIPVVVYVTPGGAHAGSAGVFITLAAHIAAMTPGTNIGAAHPVGLRIEGDSVMNEKATNDAVAFVRTIAENRKRNTEWAGLAVRKSFSITATEALESNVIDLIAANTQDLLDSIDGRAITLASGTATIHTKNARIETMEMRAVEKLLDAISDPNIAYILLLMGLFGILFELYNPGAILPGIVGVISIILSFYSLHSLPVNYAGLALIVFAVILFLLEIKIISHGLLAIGGIVSLFLGSIMLIPVTPSTAGLQISRTIIVISTIVSALFFIFILGMGLKAQRLKPVSGVDGMIGESGETLDDLTPYGRVRLHGETWNAKSVNKEIEKGAQVRVVGIEGLQLHVEPIKNSSK